MELNHAFLDRNQMVSPTASVGTCSIETRDKLRHPLQELNPVFPGRSRAGARHPQRVLMNRAVRMTGFAPVRTRWQRVLLLLQITSAKGYRGDPDGTRTRIDRWTVGYPCLWMTEPCMKQTTERRVPESNRLLPDVQGRTAFQAAAQTTMRILSRRPKHDAAEGAGLEPTALW